MTQPTFVSTSTVQNSLGAITVAAPPTYAAGDLLLLLVHTNNQTVATPSNWTPIINDNTGGTGAGHLSLHLFAKIAIASEPSVTIADTGDHQFGTMYAFTDVGLIADIVSTSNPVTTASTTYTATAITTVYPDCLGVVIMGNAVDSNTNSSPTTASATGSLGTFTLQETDNFNTGTGGGWSLFTSPADQGTAGVGSTGTITGTGTSSRQVNITLALPPVYSRASVIT